MLASLPTATRRVQRVRHEIKRREVRVHEVQAIGASVVAITFAGESLADFVSASFDDHVKLFFSDAQGAAQRRDYTPRRYDRNAGTLTVEFALHGDGAAANWARQARPGDSATVAGPRGSMIVPTDYSWHLLAGDLSALPAIKRRLEELPAQARAFVFVQATEPADRVPLHSAAAMELHWVPDDSALLEALRAWPVPPGDGYAWCAGEAATMKQLREVLVQQKQLPPQDMRVAAYWKRGASDFHEDL